MDKGNFLAFDLGATSGRAVLGTTDGVRFEMKEIHRFPTTLLTLHGKYYWDVFSLFESLKKTLFLCAREGRKIDSIGIDTWGVDFGHIASDGTILGLPRAYRDPYTQGAPEAFFREVPREEVYALTGIQIMDFNSLYQLYCQKKEDFAPLKYADRILFMPDLLAYMLTGNSVCEYTDASTSQLLNPTTKRFEQKLLRAAGVSPSILPQTVVMPGTVVGTLTDDLAEETGLGKVPVVAVAGHDTASAVAAVPASNPGFAYLSSGTWSLMGIESEHPVLSQESFQMNFTNEGGIDGTIRLLKNITGMWLLEQCRKEWEKQGRTYTYPQIVEMAQSETGFSTRIFPDDPRFANPRSMPEAIADYCAEKGLQAPQSDAQFVRCIFLSLAARYREVLDMLRQLSPVPIEKLHVIGGGSQNDLLNRLTANEIGIPVVAGPSEATAIGNCLVQAMAAGWVKDRWHMRRIIAESFPLKTFYPEKE